MIWERTGAGFTGAGGARTSTVTVALVREPALLQSHWCENQHCYSRTGARTSTVTVALVREPALLQSHWCENQHCCSRTGARTSTVTVALVREPAPLQNSIGLCLGIGKLSPLRWGLHWQQGTEPVRDRFKWLCKGKNQKLWCSRNGEPSQHYSEVSAERVGGCSKSRSWCFLTFLQPSIQFSPACSGLDLLGFQPTPHWCLGTKGIIIDGEQNLGWTLTSSVGPRLGAGYIFVLIPARTLCG